MLQYALNIYIKKFSSAMRCKLKLDMVAGMMKHIVAVLLVFIGILSFQEGAAGDGYILVRLDTYTNPGGLGYNGHCCDGKYGVCQSNGCDHKFTICLDSKYHEDVVDPLACLYGHVQTSEVKNANSLEFGYTVGGQDNPMTFVIIGALPSSFKFMVEVWDDDNVSGDDYVELLKDDITLSADPRIPFNVVLQGRTRLEARVWRECVEEWYGRLCDTQCLAPQDYHHYRCNTTNGLKICNQGWSGVNCDLFVTLMQAVTPAAHPGRADCEEWAEAGYAHQEGVYYLTVPGRAPFTVWCRMDKHGMGWTVIQRRRAHPSGRLVNFTRSWAEYREGFGDLGWDTEIWGGLENIHRLTTHKRFSVLIKMQIGSGAYVSAKYKTFWVDSEVNGYALHVGNYSGNAGNALEFRGMGGKRNHQGQPFSTYDRDNDAWEDGSCAKKYQSGWWFNDCAWANLNGVYSPAEGDWPRCRGQYCIPWRTIEGYEGYSLLATEMRLLPQP